MSGVLAIVVTFERPDMLRTCLSSLLTQFTQGLQKIHVVINSGDQETLDVVLQARTDVAGSSIITYERCDNEGPAGGFHKGLRFFLEKTNCDFAWLMDDDVIVEGECLAEMVKSAAMTGYVFPRVVTGDGRAYFSFGWSAVLLSRGIVQKVGLPIRDFFYWTEDTEYLQNRIMRVFGIHYVQCDQALVKHFHAIQKKRPSWYYYYAVRNTLYYRSYIAGYTWYRFKRTLYLFPSTLFSILAREDRKLKKLAFFLYGAYHGFTGKIGKLVDPEKHK